MEGLSRSKHCLFGASFLPSGEHTDCSRRIEHIGTFLQHQLHLNIHRSQMLECTRRKTGVVRNVPGCTSWAEACRWPMSVAGVQLCNGPRIGNLDFLTCIEHLQIPPPLRPPLHSLAFATMSCLRMRRTQFASQVSLSQPSECIVAPTTFHTPGVLRTEACATFAKPERGGCNIVLTPIVSLKTIGVRSCSLHCYIPSANTTNSSQRAFAHPHEHFHPHGQRHAFSEPET
jgi:hypothetical protein